LATIRELEKKSHYEHMARLTKKLTEGITQLAARKNIRLYCAGIESIWQLEFGIDAPMIDYRDNFKVNKSLYQNFRMAGLERGIRFHPSRGRFYTSAAHTDKDVDQTLMVIDKIFSELF